MRGSFFPVPIQLSMQILIHANSDIYGIASTLFKYHMNLPRVNDLNNADT